MNRKVFRIMADYTKIKLNDGGWIPTIAFGTGTSYFNRNDDVCEGLFKAVKIGYKLIDTADLYGTEVGVGKGLMNVMEHNLCKREDLFITTKVSPQFLTFQEVVDMVEKSLENLQLDYIDLVLIHFPGLPKESPEKLLGVENFVNNPTDPEKIAESRMEMWEALQVCQTKGKIKHIGVSNHNRHHIEQLIRNPRCKVIPAVNQIEFNPYMTDNDILDACIEHNIIVQGYGPLGSGTISTYVGDDPKELSDHVLDDPMLKSIATKIGCTTAQVCIGYSLAKGLAAVTQMETEAFMKENLQSSEIAGKLTKEDLQSIDTLNRNRRKFWDPYLVA